MSMVKYRPPEFKVTIDDSCTRCQRCVKDCSFDALRFVKIGEGPLDGRVVPDHRKCVSCHRCLAVCSALSISVTRFPLAWGSEGPNWTPELQKNIRKQSHATGKLLGSTGNNRAYQIPFDHLVIDACQVTNPPIDPLREPMELRTYLGAKPVALEIKKNESHSLVTKLGPQIRLETPIYFAAMSYGAVSLNIHKSLAKAAANTGTIMNCGEGGLHDEIYPFASNVMVQVASGRFGINNRYLNETAGIEIKIGQGAKPGIGGHLPGEKVTAEISRTRMIPEGTDALSPAPHHDIYSIEDLRQLIYAIKEATRYRKAVSVKIAAVHNVAAIASGVVRAGADIVVIDGFRGGTGAAPVMMRDHIGIPIELALASVDDRLRQEGIRHQASVVASGSIRSAADVVKAIALGADVVSIGTAALMAMGCTLCQQCHTGRCAWGICTQRPDLVKRVDPEEGAELATNLIKSWSMEIKEILGALGINALESLRGNRERLRGVGLDQTTLDILGVKPAGR